MRRSSSCALLATAAVVLASAPGTAAAPPVRGTDYAGSVAGGGSIVLSVSRDGRRLHSPVVSGVPTKCGELPTQTEMGFAGSSPEQVAQISRGGRFRKVFEVESDLSTFSGRFLAGGLVRGRFFASTRNGCSADVPFSARARPRGRELTWPLFHYIGDAGHAREGGPASSALAWATGVDELPDGSLIVASATPVRFVRAHPLIHRIDRDGRLELLLDRQDGIDLAGDIAVLPGGGFVFSQPRQNCVRKVGADGALSIAAGRCEDGPGGFAGDGGPATAALMSSPSRLAALPDGGFLVTDGRGRFHAGLFPSNTRVRRVWPDGTISTVAGTGLEGSAGDGGPATAASFTGIGDVAAQPDGGFLVADEHARRVRRVGPNGNISTVAGSGLPGFAGDGGPAAGARLVPSAVAALDGGAFLVTDLVTGRLRRVSAGGTIETVAGGGEVATGVPALQAGRLEREVLEVLASGSIVTSRELIAAPGERRLLAGLPARSITYRRVLRRGRGIPIAVSRRSRATVELRRGRRRLLRASRIVPAGRSALRLPGRLRERRRRIPYELVVTARSGRAIATARFTLVYR